MAGKYSDGDGTANRFDIFDMTDTSDAPVSVLGRGQFNDGRLLSVSLTQDLIISAFIVFCADANIPASRASVKPIARTYDGVALDMVARNIDAWSAVASPDQTRTGFNPAQPARMRRVRP